MRALSARDTVETCTPVRRAISDGSELAPADERRSSSASSRGKRLIVSPPLVTRVAFARVANDVWMLVDIIDGVF